jgi:hypothetical protein
MNPTPPSSRRIKPPIHGRCRWISRKHGLLRINTIDYTVVRLTNGYRLVNLSNGNVYDLDRDGRSCTCPAFVWDHCPVQAGGDGRCKHIAALRGLGLLPGPDDLSKSA